MLIDYIVLLSKKDKKSKSIPKKKSDFFPLEIQLKTTWMLAEG